MKSYRVTLTLTQKEFIDFVDKNFMSTLTIVPLVEEQADAVPAPSPAPYSRHQDTDAIYTPQRGPRKKRGSKVNEAILNTIMDGHGDVSSLKAALEQAGMSPASLSTGLAILQKSGRISRAPDGQYVSNQVREAAE